MCELSCARIYQRLSSGPCVALLEGYSFVAVSQNTFTVCWTPPLPSSACNCCTSNASASRFTAAAAASSRVAALAHSASRACSSTLLAFTISAASTSQRASCLSACAVASSIARTVLSLRRRDVPQQRQYAKPT